MSRQDKATTERNARTLREFVKRPENKFCADCKRNDPRWASWNLGVYLCIRCSGIHRGMGTHISKVKSIDLDTWTPDQMQSIEKWGNRRANLYWEAHLKVGHVPPEHKMESFIRSKYESRRWALDGPPPSDPSVLEDGSGISAPAPVTSESLTEAPPPQTQPQARTSTSFSRPAATPPLTNRQPQPHQLLSTAIAGRAPPTLAPPIPGPGQTQAAAQAQAQQKAPEPDNDLFSLDFHAPSSANNGTAQQQQPRKDVKNDILSLFAPPAQANANNNAFGQFQSSPPSSASAAASSSSPWGSFGSVQTSQAQPQPTSMMGTSGAGAWGASSGWTAPAPPAQGNLWGTAPTTAPVQQQQAQSNLFGGNVWGSSGGGSGLGNGGMSGMSGLGGGGSDMWGAPSGSGGAGQGLQKKDDAFGDLWGGFK